MSLERVDEVRRLPSGEDALDVHAGVNAAAPPNPRMAELRADGDTQREDYEYNRTR